MEYKLPERSHIYQAWPNAQTLDENHPLPLMSGYVHKKTWSLLSAICIHLLFILAEHCTIFCHVCSCTFNLVEPLHIPWPSRCSPQCNWLHNMVLYIRKRSLRIALLSLFLKATAHTRLRACDHCTSSTLIGGKGRTSPSLLHTMLEGPME